MVHWREILQVQEAESEIKIEKKCTCGNGNCRKAKQIKCTCRCHAKEHGAENRKGMCSLETFSEPQILEVNPVIDTAWFGQLCAESMLQVTGKPFKPIRRKRLVEELAVLA